MSNTNTTLNSKGTKSIYDEEYFVQQLLLGNYSQVRDLLTTCLDLDKVVDIAIKAYTGYGKELTGSELKDFEAFNMDLPHVYSMKLLRPLYLDPDIRKSIDLLEATCIQRVAVGRNITFKCGFGGKNKYNTDLLWDRVLELEAK